MNLRVKLKDPRVLCLGCGRLGSSPHPIHASHEHGIGDLLEPATEFESMLVSATRPPPLYLVATQDWSALTVAGNIKKGCTKEGAI